MNIVSVIGARPQFIKAAPLSKQLRKQHREILVHTGQHYDYGMSEVFFKELEIPEPDINLGVGSGNHGAQTGTMIAALEDVCVQHKPDVVLVYGDTNSTLAGALAAAKLHIPVAHVEAGLRSFNRRMPEEINRIVADRLSQWLFVPSQDAVKNLSQEGITDGVHIVGDIMYDALLQFKSRATQVSNILTSLHLQPHHYFLATIHRAENTDDQDHLTALLAALQSLDTIVVLPLHPRTRSRIDQFCIDVGTNITMIDPVGYLDMLQLMQTSDCILTDSGGVQKEAYYLNIPCITLREETEWVETVQTGWNAIVGTSPEKFHSAIKNLSTVRSLPHPDLYGNGTTAQKIVENIGK
jgi:UDP-N-acetylglucosamine 2-epimerase